MRGNEVANAFRQQADELGGLIGEHKQLANDLGARITQLEEQLAQARRELAAIYLPSLEDAAIDKAQRLTGFQGFTRRDPRVAMAQERKVLTSRVPQLESDPRYARRALLVGPDGTLTQERDQAAESLAPLQAECEKFESQLGFQELVDIGYDTPKFTEHWWQGAYWKHWAAGDRICKALGMADFGDDVLPAYQKWAEPRNTLAADVARLDAEIAAVHALVQERDQLADRLSKLDSIYLAQAQQFLGEHLEHADVALLEQWVAGDAELERAVRVCVRKLAGLNAKRQFITEIRDDGIRPLVGELDTRRQKYQQKRAKFSRPKNAYGTFAATTIDQKFPDRAAALRAQQDKVRRRVDALMAADNYADFDLRNDSSLWWMHFLGAPPPRLAPNLYGYYQARPTIVPLLDPDYVDMTDEPDTAHAATAFMSRDQEQGGYLS
ncbi:MAG: hypothetical protein K8W52_46705 [Deltaproteobacteria bacterium]|nr:hypothetical protein [Deltaproteobacteria bacterium]